ncbi:hypothetical protein RND81_05G229400 [Saponaria officinalis]|uniref:Retrovirus-related Pol polyprotein from transposon TNT 1-94-like beta-barrel domain-containing protein n=1 Tax=Saponaria officinalis TaxID=3572 RepID=A0AAW1L0T5_SAPOF
MVLSKKPPKTDKKHHQWVRCDLLVVKWILNSIDKPIKDTLAYVTSSKDLWTEILDRYGQSNNVEVYQLKKELGDIVQSGSSLVEYYSKLKHTWESIDSIDPIPTCTCGALESCTCAMLKRVIDRESQSKLIQFLMGLNQQYESVKTTFLSMEPLPALNKAFAMLQNIERQKQISDAVEVLAEANAYACAAPTEGVGSKKPKFNTHNDSDDVKTCNYCHHLGHTKDECFKLRECSHCGVEAGLIIIEGIDLHIMQMLYVHYGADAELTPIDDIPATHSNTSAVSPQFHSSGAPNDSHMNRLVDTVMQKVLQALSEKPSPSSLSSANFAYIIYCSSAITAAHHFSLDGWVVDTGASDHMTPHLHLLQDIRTLSRPLLVALPDGRINMVTMVGNAQLTPQIQLQNVLVIPEFRHNLLSIGRLTAHSNLIATFTHTGCLI